MLRLTFETKRKRTPLNPMIPALFGALVKRGGSDYRGMPSTVCPCGYDVFIACVSFDDDRTVSSYVLDGVCAACGSLASLPTPIDYEEKI
jgi:hypothetical protein